MLKFTPLRQLVSTISIKIKKPFILLKTAQDGSI